jgi:hypothetical protein
MSEPFKFESNRQHLLYAALYYFQLVVGASGAYYY